MRNRSKLVAALAGAVLLAGCPLPQPLPEVAPGTATPPRIVMDEITVDGGLASSRALVLVPAGCTGARRPAYALGARLVDTTLVDSVVARWFVDYLPADTVRRRPRQQNTVPPPASETDLFRVVPPFQFGPYDHQDPVGALPNDAPGVVHVVELVVSNNFDPAGADPGEDAVPPYRAAATGFETQTFRWVFVSAATGAGLECPAPP